MRMMLKVTIAPSHNDMLSGMSGVGFDVAQRGRVDVSMGHLRIGAIGRADQSASEKACGHAGDQIDIELLPPE